MSFFLTKAQMIVIAASCTAIPKEQKCKPLIVKDHQWSFFLTDEGAVPR